MSLLNLRFALVGLVATLTLDVLTLGALKLHLVAPLPPSLIGRWFTSVARARPFHADIARAAPVDHEVAIAFPVHYAIGITLALVYLATASWLGLSPRGAAPAVAFGIATSVLPWLLMFPSMGYGFFGAHGPAGTRLFASSLLTHTFYGVGLWVGSSILAAR
jgi:Protein of unknown function (DUF2938)